MNPNLKTTALLATLVLAISGSASASTAEGPIAPDAPVALRTIPAALSGSVSALGEPAHSRPPRIPLGDVAVYAYRLADLSLRKVVTDDNGLFSFRSLPAGVYKVIAHKAGFAPAVVLVQRATANVLQELQLELAPQALMAEGKDGEAEGDDFWALRRRIPGDILRDIRIAGLEHSDRDDDFGATGARFAAEMRALTGVGDFGDSASAFLSGGEVDLQSMVGSISVGIRGQYQQLDARGGDGILSGLAQTQNLHLSVAPNERQEVLISGSVSRSEAVDSPVDFSRVGIRWDGQVGQGRTQVAAQFTEEQNFYRDSGPYEAALAPASSQWEVRGTYSTPVGDDFKIESGLVLSERSPQDVRFGDPSIAAHEAQRVDVYGQASHRVLPAMEIRYGVSSRLLNGDMRISPQAGVAFDLDSRWRAEAFLRKSVIEEQDRGFRDLRVSQFGSTGIACDVFGADCYQARVTRHGNSDSNSMTFAVSHRRFGQDTKLFFSDDFFDRLESLYVTEGDVLPELQFVLQRKLSPRVLTRFESHLATGGGGRLPFAGNSYENAIRYLVASLDTHFEATATELLVAFYSLQQELESTTGLISDPIVRDRLQILVTQSLSSLLGLPTDWDLLLDMQLSRRDETSLSIAESDPELNRRIVGGIAFRF